MSNAVEINPALDTMAVARNADIVAASTGGRKGRRDAGAAPSTLWEMEELRTVRKVTAATSTTPSKESTARSKSPRKKRLSVRDVNARTPQC